LDRQSWKPQPELFLVLPWPQVGVLAPLSLPPLCLLNRLLSNLKRHLHLLSVSSRRLKSALYPQSPNLLAVLSRLWRANPPLPKNGVGLQLLSRLKNSKPRCLSLVTRKLLQSSKHVKPVRRLMLSAVLLLNRPPCVRPKRLTHKVLACKNSTTMQS
jgi:hypothetical protein